MTDRRGRHLDVADDRAGAVPILSGIGGDFQDPNRGIVGVVPPRLGRRRPEFADLFAIVEDLRMPDIETYVWPLESAKARQTFGCRSISLSFWLFTSVRK